MNILTRSFVVGFYRQRVGFFLLVIALAFGIMTSREHTALAALITENLIALLLCTLTWVFYLIMVLHYCRRIFSDPAYRFIYELRFLQVFARWKSWLAIAAGMLAPVWLYAAFIAATGFKNGIPSAGILITCIVALLLATACLFLERRLHTPLAAYAPSRKANISRLPYKRPVSWIFWSLEWLIRERGLTLLLTKSATLFLLAGVLPLYEPERYDLRLPAFLFLVTGAIHAGLSQELFHWENSAYLNRRALPVPLIRRYTEATLVHAAMLLPEIILSLRYGWKLFTLAEWLSLQFFLISLLVFFYISRYKHTQPLEESPGSLLAGFVTLTLAILYNIPLILMGLLLFAEGYRLLYRYGPFGKAGM